MKLFLFFALILATSIFTISLRSHKKPSISSRLHQEMAVISLSASNDSESRHQPHSPDLHLKPITSDQTETTALATRTISINNQKYNIATLDEKDIDDITQNISSSQLNDIRDTILSPTENPLRRHAYLYFLTQIKSAGARSLFEVVKADVPEFSFEGNPHSGDANRKNLELSLRIAALEALDHIASLDPHVSQYIQQLETSQAGDGPTNALLSYLTSISNTGVETNQPGKLHRVLNAIIKENETL